MSNNNFEGQEPKMNNNSTESQGEPSREAIDKTSKHLEELLWAEDPKPTYEAIKKSLLEDSGEDQFNAKLEMNGYNLDSLNKKGMREFDALKALRAKAPDELEKHEQYTLERYKSVTDWQPADFALFLEVTRQARKLLGATLAKSKLDTEGSKKIMNDRDRGINNASSTQYVYERNTSGVGSRLLEKQEEVINSLSGPESKKQYQFAGKFLFKQSEIVK